jgi:para-nitrobenzyl esterase
VSVTLNHRLNVLGFLDLSEYGEKYRYSGLVGMQDLVAALQWVHDNIEAFGGDPENVMIFGQSGGGSKVSTLLQIPAADGLYHKAAIQSGVPSAGPNVTKKDSLLFAKTLVEGLGLTAETIDTIEKLPYTQICEKANELFGQDLMWKIAPAPDGDYYMGMFIDVGFRPETKNIPVLVGCNMGEFNRPTTEEEHDRWTEEQKRAKIAERFQEDTAEAIRIFQEAYPGIDILFLLDTDSKVRPRTLQFAEMRASQSDAKVYSYMLTYLFPFLGGRTAWHCAEIPYVFRNPLIEYADVTGGSEDSLVLDAAIGGAWAAFARTGNPCCDAVPDWPAFTCNHPATMLFHLSSHAEEGHDKALMEMMKKHPLPSDNIGMRD